jgi:hypothetical protein
MSSRMDTTTARMDTTQMLKQVRDITTGAIMTSFTPKTATGLPSTTVAVMIMLMTTLTLKVLTEDGRTDEATVRTEITIHVLKELIRHPHILLRLLFVKEHPTQIPFLHI